MVRRDGAEMRKERMQAIAQIVQRNLVKNGEIPLTQTLAVLQYEFGLTKEKLTEYLQVLENVGRFTLHYESDKIRKIPS